MRLQRQSRSLSLTTPSSDQREQRLNAVIADYLQAVQAGRAPNRRELLERHWDLTDGLVSFFGNEDHMKRLAGLPSPLLRVESYAERFSRSVDSGRGLSASRGFGEFELLNEIARGGMGIVYKARHKRLNRIVALKTIQPGLSRATDDVVGRLRLEAKIDAALDHPNIVPLYEIGEHGGYPYLILKLIPGGDLERHVARMSKSPRAAARLMAKVARTVRYAHLNGVLHCDLKPSNILLDLQGVPFVTDFGLAKRLENESGLSRTGLILGTPSYMAPEQITARRGEMTEAVDIYGMGAVLYKLLARRPPFQGNTVFELLEQVLESQPDSLREQNRAVDRELEAICMKCLEKEPAHRYPTAGACASDLERWLAGARRSSDPWSVASSLAMVPSGTGWSSPSRRRWFRW